jgi:hypothetical protein
MTTGDLEWKAAAAELKADRAARRGGGCDPALNNQLSRGRNMLWSPTIRAALLAGTPWLNVFCPGCGTSRAPMPRLLGLYALPPARPRERAPSARPKGENGSRR